VKLVTRSIRMTAARTIARVGEIAAKAVVQLTPLRDGRDFHGRRAA
jgi:hypothetical protein